LKECEALCSDGVKLECHLPAASVDETTLFTDVPKSTLHVQLPGFSILRSALSCLASGVQSFVAKVALLKLILWHWVTIRRLQLCLTPLHQIC